MKRFIEILLLLLGATKGYPPTHPIMEYCEEQEDKSDMDEDEEERELWEFIRKWGS